MDASEIVWHIFAVIGAVKILTWILPWLYTKLFCRINLFNYKYGYVLITGASDGIGKALAKDFARRGFNLILLSRTLSKLESTKSEIQFIYPLTRIELIPIDFSFSHKDPITFYNNLFNQLKEFEISVLVNNVGVVDTNSLLSGSFEDIENMIGVNIYPSTYLTHKFLPVFLERFKEKKLKSLVINFSSVVEEAISVGTSVYAATKKFNAVFGEGLRYEYGDIQFAVVSPGPVDTFLGSKFGKEVPLRVKSDVFAKDLLSGLRTGVNHGHWKHKVMATGISIWPYLMSMLVLRMMIPTLVKQGIFKYKLG